MRLKFLIILSGVFLLSSCAQIKKLDGSKDYQKVKPYDKAILIPSDLSSGSIDNLYPVPQAKSGTLGDHEPLPPRNVA